MKRIFLFDNKDSFTYNLVHYLEGFGLEVIVCRNDESPENWPKNVDGLVLSPGPGLPEESGYLMEVIDLFWGEIPILGICLGNQAIALHAGGKLKQINEVFHGVAKEIEVLETQPLFLDLSQKIIVGLYHSWVVDEKYLPADFTINSCYQDLVMGIQHKTLPVQGIQFHPESVMTDEGKKILMNWVKWYGQKSK